MQNKKRNWKTVETGDSYDNIWDFQKEEYIEGEYKGKEENVGQNKSTIFTIKKDDGTLVKVWGHTVLADKMNKLEEGDYILIQFLGKKKGERYDYYDFKVDVDEAIDVEKE